MNRVLNIEKKALLSFKTAKEQLGLPVQKGFLIISDQINLKARS